MGATVMLLGNVEDLCCPSVPTIASVGSIL